MHGIGDTFSVCSIHVPSLLHYCTQLLMRCVLHWCSEFCMHGVKNPAVYILTVLEYTQLSYGDWCWLPLDTDAHNDINLTMYVWQMHSPPVSSHHHHHHLHTRTCMPLQAFIPNFEAHGYTRFEFIWGTTIEVCTYEEAVHCWHAPSSYVYLKIV